MITLSHDHIRSVVNTIWTQIVKTTEPNIIGSWGLSGLNATQIVKTINGNELAMAALILKVAGFAFQGEVYVALDEGADYYRIYFLKDGNLQEQCQDIGCEELGQVLDRLIETGGLTKEQYEAKIKQEYGFRIPSM